MGDSVGGNMRNLKLRKFRPVTSGNQEGVGETGKAGERTCSRAGRHLQMSTSQHEA
jgi:hypothetical protein